ncbi:hypothetical protein NPX13_g224 [Xylaria arbuscula]|uniref:Uncharacterized protein n=1 Tax=Xylaria arbuscula TaxID=114810 RepID=A0A9W8TSJ0_9PEZI|nr:hypothetical protein NPX13_g224 [Xylaria arbuscula]
MSAQDTPAQSPPAQDASAQDPVAQEPQPPAQVEPQPPDGDALAGPLFDISPKCSRTSAAFFVKALANPVALERGQDISGLDDLGQLYSDRIRRRAQIEPTMQWLLPGVECLNSDPNILTRLSSHIRCTTGRRLPIAAGEDAWSDYSEAKQEGPVMELSGTSRQALILISRLLKWDETWTFRKWENGKTGKPEGTQRFETDSTASCLISSVLFLFNVLYWPPNHSGIIGE